MCVSKCAGKMIMLSSRNSQTCSLFYVIRYLLYDSTSHFCNCNYSTLFGLHPYGLMNYNASYKPRQGEKKKRKVRACRLRKSFSLSDTHFTTHTSLLLPFWRLAIIAIFTVNYFLNKCTRDRPGGLAPGAAM